MNNILGPYTGQCYPQVSITNIGHYKTYTNVDDK